MDRPLPARVASTCLARGLLAPRDRVLVAVSGGADSTALALLLAEAGRHGLPLALVLAHVDHGWRGAAEAAADRRHVAAVAARLGRPLVTASAPPDLPHREEAARRWRYRCLDEAARSNGCAKVATGHHLRDQAETVLMRLLRGSGPAGLRGIPVRRPLGEGGVEVVRPLLEEDPRALRAWLHERGMGWREDETNEDLSRDRARARRRLLEVEARGGSASRHLAELAERLRRRLERDEVRLAETLDAAVVHHVHADAVEAPRALLASLAPGLLDLAFRRLGRLLHANREGPWFTRRHLDACRRVLAEGGAVDLPRSLRFQVSGPRAWLRRVSLAAHPAARLEREDVPTASFDLAAYLARDASWEAAVDADRLGPTAVVRPVQPEDVFVPWGREPRRPVGVLAWLARRQVPVFLREAQVVVEGASGIAWVPGHRVDRSHAVGEGTRTVAHLTVRW